MNLIDTHAHLIWDCFKPDFEEVLKKAYDTGVKTVINVGPDLKTSPQVVELNCFPLKSYATIGIHPNEADHYGIITNLEETIDQDIKILIDIYESDPKKVVGIGECGLDYYFDTHKVEFPGTTFSYIKKIQKKLFITQINLTKKLNLPLIIHCRDAWQDIFNFDFTGTKGVFHSFTGNSEQAKKVLDLGFYLGFTCIVTYPKNEYLREIIKEIPLDKILTETDCPFLPPQLKRGQRSEPADVVEVIKVISQMKNLSFEKAAEATFENAVRLFKLA